MNPQHPDTSRPPVRSRGAAVSAVGAVMSAAAASLCCLGPLLLATLGLGGAGLLGALEPYRPLLVGVTLALLGAGFFLTYRRPAPSVEAGGEACACALPGGSRLSRWMLWGATLLVAGMLGLSSTGGLAPRAVAAETPGAAPPSARSAVATLSIEGMTCPSCTTAVRMALERLEGVREAQVSYEERRARVTYEPTKVRPEQLAQAVTALGYTTRVTATQEH